MEKTPKELLPEDKNARVSISYEAEMAVLKGKFKRKNIANRSECFLVKEKATALNGMFLPGWRKCTRFALNI